MTEERKGFYFELLDLLEQDPKKRFYADNGKDLLRNKIYECAMKMDKDLIKLLLSNDKMKAKFFADIDGTLVFDKTAFGWAINNKAFLQDSYTRFKNAIGLMDSKEQFISSKNDVVLSFPYKDCVLEGGQTKEDQKREEIYYNELLAPDDIDRLLAPKVFTNMMRYTKDGEESLTEFKDSDNLLIKGNNLLALSSLLKRYEGRVKCIYIDPPYNTGNDGFNYNDNFNHSTWLAFMKNRLSLAKKMLAKDGSIWISLDDREQAYCKILCDEIFGRDNFVNNVIWQKKYSPQNDARYLSDTHDFILVYAKDKSSWICNLLPRTKEMNSRYKNPDNDPRGDWKSSDLSVKTYCKEYDYPITTPSGRVVTLPEGRCWMTSKENMQKYIEDNRIYFGENGNNVPSLKRFLSEVKQGITPTTIWFRDEVGDNQEAKQHLVKLVPENIFKTPKPERLIKKILAIATNESDLVLDFYAGSGTTLTTALKMKR